MSRENVEAFERAVAAVNRRDVDAVLEELDPDVEWHPLAQVMLGDRIVAVGRIRARGKESGAETESAIGWVAEYERGKMIRIRDYLDPQEALKAVGLPE